MMRGPNTTGLESESPESFQVHLWGKQAPVEELDLSSQRYQHGVQAAAHPTGIAVHTTGKLRSAL